MNDTTPGRLRTWLQLLRAPNLFTVPGDPLVGCLVASAGFTNGNVWLAVAASLCFYAAGLLMNDLADVEEDRRDRPTRPLPSGAAARGTVWAVTSLLVLAGMGALLVSGERSAVIAGGVLVGAMALYNFVTKGWRVVGALNMGLCRALSVLLGGFMGPEYGQQLAIPIALLFGLYIAAVTNLARHETKPRVPVLARCLPAFVMLLICFAGSMQANMAPEKAPAIALFGVLAMAVIWYAVRMFQRARIPLPAMIGAHIRLMLPMQAALAWVADPYGLGRVSAIILLVLWPVARVVSRWFYAS